MPLFRLIVLQLLLAVPFLAPALSYGAARTGLTVAASSDGIQLSLSIPRPSYPRDALVLATIRLRNLTHHTVQVPVVGAGCSTVVVQVYNRPQHPLFPPTFPDALDTVSCTPHIPTVSLAPGSTRVSHLPIILRGSHLRLVATLPIAGASTVTTPAITVQLTARTGVPTITLHTGRSPYADVRPPQHARGPLMVTEWLACNGGSRVFGDPWNSVWSSSMSNRIAPQWHWLPGCTGQREWHALAGWLNHPVVDIAWSGP
jgi:hypothetical protein